MGTVIYKAPPLLLFCIGPCVLICEIRIRAVRRFKKVMFLFFFYARSKAGVPGHLHVPSPGRVLAAPVVLWR